MSDKFEKFLRQQKEGNLLYVKWLIKNEILTIKDVMIIIEELEDIHKLWIEEKQKLKSSAENQETSLLSE